VTEDNGTGVTWGVNQNGTANAAVKLFPNATTHRGVLLKQFFTPFNATAYGGGTVATDNDLLTVWVFVAEPNNLLTITLNIERRRGDGHSRARWRRATRVDGHDERSPRADADVSRDRWTRSLGAGAEQHAVSVLTRLVYN